MKKIHLVGITLICLGITASILLLLGRIPWCSCGYIKIWQSSLPGFENSQHIFDHYTLTHVIHGILLYLLAWLLAKKQSKKFRYVLALIFECLWEIVENSPFIINRYRAATISYDYYGDSVVNSLGDIVASILGYIIASQLSILSTVFIVLIIEMFLAFTIRDNLTLNIIMLIHPSQNIMEWQKKTNK